MTVLNCVFVTLSSVSLFGCKSVRPNLCSRLVLIRLNNTELYSTVFSAINTTYASSTSRILRRISTTNSMKSGCILKRRPKTRAIFALAGILISWWLTVFDMAVLLICGDSWKELQSERQRDRENAVLRIYNSTYVKGNPTVMLK